MSRTPKAAPEPSARQTLEQSRRTEPSAQQAPEQSRRTEPSAQQTPDQSRWPEPSARQTPDQNRRPKHAAPRRKASSRAKKRNAASEVSPEVSSKTSSETFSGASSKTSGKPSARASAKQAPGSSQRAQKAGAKTKAAARKGKRQTGAPGFALKLTLVMLLVLTLALSLGGTMLLAGNFSDSLNEAVQQAEAQHLLQCYALESDLQDVIARGETVTDSHLARYGSTLADYTGGRMAALFCAPADEDEAGTAGIPADGPASPDGDSAPSPASDGAAVPAGDGAAVPADDGAAPPSDAGTDSPENNSPYAPEGETALLQVYSSFPWAAAASGQEDAYRMHRTNGKTYMLFETSVRVVGAPAVTLLTGHDVTDVLAARDRALVRFWEMELVVLVCAGAVIALLSRWLTRPLARLTEASESIAAGAYDERTGITGGDEIGVLSRSFDTMAAAIEEKVAALELSVRQREDFMSAFSHELKTPMTAVIGFADTLRSVQCEPEDQRRAAGYIYSEARRVESLSQKLLQLLGLSDTPPTLVPLALDEIFLRTHRALSPFISPIKLKVRPAPGVLVMGDADLLTDLVYNLVWNAVRAKPRDGFVHLRWQWADDGAAVDLTVWDTGCGIPPEAIERVTEPFFMVDKSRARAGGGSGIGLALCKKIAEVHGGGLHIESTLGEGSAFTVRLAAAPGQTQPEQITAASPAAEQPEPADSAPPQTRQPENALPAAGPQPNAQPYPQSAQPEEVQP